jgi:hypothetical protein
VIELIKMELYKYEHNKPRYNLYIGQDSFSGQNKSWLDALNKSRVILTFDSPVKTDSIENNTVYAELFLKCDDKEIFNELLENKKTDKLKKPLVILIHGFATKDKKRINYYRFIKNLFDHGFSCLFIHLPFHLKRTPANESSGHRMVHYGDRQTLDFFNQAVLDIRKAVNIASDILGPRTIDICGVSLGSMVAIIAKAFEPKISKAILVIGGGNWNQIHWNGFMRFVLKGNCVKKGKITKEKCTHYYNNFYDFISEFKRIDPKDIESELKEHKKLKELCCKYCYLCDPITFAFKAKPEDVLMINARFDHVFSRESTSQLWESLSRPQIHWLNYIHKTDILEKEASLKNIIKFLL